MPELCLLRAQLKNPTYSLRSVGVTHVLLSGGMLPKRAREYEVIILVRRKPSAGARRCTLKIVRASYYHWGNWPTLLVLKSCLGRWICMDAVQSQEDMANDYSTSASAKFDRAILEPAAKDPKMTKYFTQDVKAKMCEGTPYSTAAYTSRVAHHSHNNIRATVRQQDQNIRI